MKKKMLAFGLGVALVSSLATAMATGTITSITASSNPTISIVYNGETQTLTDASGTVLYPISYLGSTYVPIRAVSTIFGEDVNWDGTTNTITLGAMEKQPLDLTTQISYGTDYSWKLLSASDLTVSGSDANETYASGLCFDIWNSSSSFSGYRGISLDVTGYSTLSFIAWSDIDAEIIVANGDGNTIYKQDVSANSLTPITIDITGQTTIKFGADAQKTMVNGTAKFFEPTVS